MIVLTYAEKTILLHLSLLNLSDNNIEALNRAVTSDPRWDLIFKVAQANGTHCLMYMHLKNLGLLARIQDNARNNIESIYFSQSLLQETLFEAMRTVLLELNSRGIVPITLKASSLAHSLYKDIRLRPSCDLDIMVKDKEWAEVKEVMSRLEYIPTNILEGDLLEITYYKKGNEQIVIEISTGLNEIEEYGNIVLPPTRDIWERAKRDNFMGIPVMRLSTEDELIQLVSHHVSTHYLLGLIWLCDIIEFIRANREAINWHILIANARTYRQANALCLVLYFAKQIGGINIEKEMMLVRNNWSFNILKKIYNDKNLKFIDPGYLQQNKNLIRLLLIDGIRGKAFFVLRRLFPHHQWLKHRYEEHRFKNAYVLIFIYHQYRFFLDCVKAVTQLFTRNPGLRKKIENR